jgi:hypothetical protein
MLRVIGYLFILVCIQSSICYAQDPKVKVSAYDGIVIVGYVDNGGFSNFTGPNINLVYKDSKFILGALPSLRYKQDNSTPKNSFVTPNLGIGFTYSYKLFAIQIPLYYNAKTATQNGNWQIGFGLGLRLNEFNTKNKKI